MKPNVYQLQITDNKPIWFYCAQTDGGHCQKGMSGVINENFSSSSTLAAYQAAASLTSSSTIPAIIEGGYILPNPNPNAGVN
jgi:hypothetical protein